MKEVKALLKFLAAMSVSGLLLFACTNPIDPSPDPDPGNSDTTVEALDNILNQFRLSSAAVKIAGHAPSSSGSAGLKFNIKDTLHLVEGVHVPIRFLHTETTNVAGVYIHVIGGSFSSTHYYDVPEIPEHEESDTVSVVMVGFDIDELSPGVPPAGAPFVFDIILIPHDPNGNPLDETTVPVIVDDFNNSGNSPEPCGLSTGQWVWEESYIPKDPDDGTYHFFNSPNKVWGLLGQNIKGCCINGVSNYGATCLNADSTFERTLNFQTFFIYREESFIFSEDGTFARFTSQFNANPFPEESDFCGGGQGLVKEKLNNVSYSGNWTTQNFSLPEDLNEYYATADYLTLQTTSSTGFGYGNPGGIIHQLSCDYLILIQLDNEGGGRNLFKVYRRISSPEDLLWYAMNS
jgi:hypothetical protein